jgi:hypothetical protein
MRTPTACSSPTSQEICRTCRQTGSSHLVTSRFHLAPRPVVSRDWRYPTQCQSDFLRKAWVLRPDEETGWAGAMIISKINPFGLNDWLTCFILFECGMASRAWCLPRSWKRRHVVLPVPLRPSIKLDVLEWLTIAISSCDRSNGNSS